MRCHNYIKNKAVVDILYLEYVQHYVLPLYLQPCRNIIVDNKNRPHHLNGSHLCKWINTICWQKNPKLMGFFFKVSPLFLHISNCRTICRYSNNIILNYVPCMVIHKLHYVITLEQSLQMWNDGNIMKNLMRNLFCYLICSISTNMTFQTFCFKFMLFIIYNMVIRACINCFILYSNFFHDDK